MFGLTGIWRYIVPALMVLALVAVIVLGVNRCKEINQENYNTTVNAGEIKEREAGKSEVINHVQEARNAVERPTDNELNVVCSKYNRNCKNSQ